MNTAAISSALALGDGTRLDELLALIEGFDEQRGAWRLDAVRSFARAAIARADGRETDALEELRAVGPLAARPSDFYVRSLARQHAAEILSARGDHQAAGAEYAAAREPWVTAGASWYLGQLDAWARERGIPVG